LSFKASQTNKDIIIGITTDPGTQNYNHIDYAILLNNTGVPSIYENGSYKGNFGTFTVNDRFQIALTDGTVRYLKNGTLLYTSLNIPSMSAPYFLDMQFSQLGTLEEISFVGAGATGLRPDVKFIRSNATPTTPTGNDPAGWSDSVPTGTDTLWQIVGIKNGAGNLLGEWSTPAAITGLTPRGQWTDATAYYVNNTVTYNGGTYIATTAHTSSSTIKPSGTDQSNGYWDVLAAPAAPPPSGSSFGTSGTPAVVNVPASSSGQNLRSLANAAGYTGGDCYIDFVTTGSITGSPGLNGIESGTWPSTGTVSLKLTNDTGNTIRGGGGAGGAGGTGFATPGAGGAGGSAINLSKNFDRGIINNGTIQGGSGGGGGGKGSKIYDNEGGYLLPVGGGGGGGGFPNGAGGASTGMGGNVGGAGTTSGGGTGGASTDASDGGNGGGVAAQAGSVGGGSGGGLAGAAGYAVKKNGFTATVTNNATLTGTVG
jgi:hypothetical protein